MHRTLILAGREFRGFLRSPLGYALLAMYALVSGLILVTLLFFFHDQILQAAQRTAGMPAPQAGPSLQVTVITPYFLNVASLLLFIVPFLTMRTFAEEKRTRSLEVLVSYPVREWELVLGKFAGVFAFTALLFAISAIHLIVIALVSTPAAPPLLAGFLGLILFGAGLIAIGLFISSLATGQVEAAVLTLGLFLGLAMMGGVLRPGGSWLQLILANASPLYQYQFFGRGVLAASRVLFHVVTATLFIALAIRGVDFIKWRG